MLGWVGIKQLNNNKQFIEFGDCELLGKGGGTRPTLWELLPPCLGLGLIWIFGDVGDSGKGNGKELTLFALAVV
jgi:hypothetical protein